MPSAKAEVAIAAINGAEVMGQNVTVNPNPPSLVKKDVTEIGSPSTDGSGLC